MPPPPSAPDDRRADDDGDDDGRPGGPARSNRGPVTSIVVALLVVAAVGIVAFTRGDPATEADRGPTWNGAVIEPATPRPTFTLTDTEGRPYDFAAETAGDLTFLFFGYTNCPDICPISMATLTAALDELSDVGATVVFVTTDPGRDTPERLRSWLNRFDPAIVGLTGTVADLEAAQRAAGVTAAVAEAPDEDGRYTVGHSAALSVYTPDDLQHLTYGSGTTQSEWMADIPRIAAEPAWNQPGAEAAG